MITIEQAIGWLVALNIAELSYLLAQEWYHSRKVNKRVKRHEEEVH